MKRRDFLTTTAGASVILAASSIPYALSRREKQNGTGSMIENAPEKSDKLQPPVKGRIAVAFAISEGVTVIDFAGPWEVFQDVMLGGSGEDMQMPFQLFTVAEKTEPIRGSAGLKLLPDYTFETAPQPNVLVVPAQRGSSALHEWLRKVSRQTDVTMSVCTGAFQLAAAGLLSGKSATTHHEYQDNLSKRYPNSDVKRGVRFVESDRVSSAGGLTSGIDLALRVVERYYGREVAQKTADYMEYQSKGWIV